MNHSVPQESSWRKSSYSQVGNSNCVEVNDASAPTIGLRDSQHPEQTVLTVAVREWAAFLREAKQRNL